MSADALRRLTLFANLSTIDRSRQRMQINAQIQLEPDDIREASVVAFEVAGARVTLSTESIKANWLKNLTAKPEPVPGIPGLFLAYGEHYAGVILGKDGAPNYHLILLPGDENEITWDKAKEWAASINGELPTRREQALLYPAQSERVDQLAAFMKTACKWAAHPAPEAAHALSDESILAVAAALESARVFIRNGVALGYIRMPDADCPDPAHGTLPLIERAMTILTRSSAATSENEK